MNKQEKLKRIWELRNELLELGQPVIWTASEHDTGKTGSDNSPSDLSIYPSNYDKYEFTRVKGVKNDLGSRPD